MAKSPEEATALTKEELEIADKLEEYIDNCLVGVTDEPFEIEVPKVGHRVGGEVCRRYRVAGWKQAWYQEYQNPKIKLFRTNRG